MPDIAANALTVTAKRLEFYETEVGATASLLKAELFTPKVWDPCCGRGRITRELLAAGYQVVATDVHDWGFGDVRNQDFLAARYPAADSVVMNPPFSKACDFVDHAFDLGCRKVAAFQRWSWYEGRTRLLQFWSRRPPNRVYCFSDRVSCYRGDLDEAAIAAMSNTPTAHGWFVWERGQPFGTVSGHLLMDRS